VEGGEGRAGGGEGDALDGLLGVRGAFPRVGRAAVRLRLAGAVGRPAVAEAALRLVQVEAAPIGEGIVGARPRRREQERDGDGCKLPSGLAVTLHSPNTQIMVACEEFFISGARESLFLALRNRPEAMAMYCLPSTA